VTNKPEPGAQSPVGGPPVGLPDPGRGDDRLTGVSAYVMLFLLGVLEALIGTFQYSRGPVPLAAVCFAALILATCVLAAWGMQTALGGLMPGAGWLLAAFALASGTTGGSVLITNTTAGKWFLFGGAACAAGGCLVAYLGWSKLAEAARAGRR
jgi:hypothetical protein